MLLIVPFFVAILLIIPAVLNSCYNSGELNGLFWGIQVFLIIITTMSSFVYTALLFRAMSRDRITINKILPTGFSAITFLTCMIASWCLSFNVISIESLYEELSNTFAR